MNRYLSKVCTLLFLFLSLTAIAQDEGVLDSLTKENCIQEYYDVLTEAQIGEFQEGKKKEWLKYLPTLGLTYTPAGEPRPGLSMSSSLIYTAYKDKQAKIKRIAAIRVINQLQSNTEQLTYTKLLGQIKMANQEIAHVEKLFAIDKELFDFYTKQYQNQELKPSEYLLKKKAYFIKADHVRKERLKIDLLMLELKVLSRCPDD